MTQCGAFPSKLLSLTSRGKLPSASATSCEHSYSNVPNKKNFLAVGENQPSTSNVLNENTKSHNNKTKLLGKSPARRQKCSAVILGDSLVKNIRAWELKTKPGGHSNIYVKCFNCANIKDLYSYVRPTIESKTNLILLRIGTSDLVQRRYTDEKSADQIACI